MTSNPDFSHLDGLKVRPSKQIEFTFERIEGEPILVVRSSGESNKPYLNALLKSGRRSLRKMRGGRMSAEVLAANRDQDRELFARHIVIGWKAETVRNAAGKPVKFSPEACAAFLQALPDDLFDELRVFCGDADNFREEDDLTQEDVEDLAKK